MAKFVVNIPVIGYISTIIEYDGDALELEHAIEQDEIDVPVNLDMLDSWYPVLDIYRADQAEYDMPFELEILDA